jgi:membrane-associated phospholipid phosphatase
MTPGAQASPWHRQVAATITMHPYVKGIGTTAFISLFFVAYFYVLRHPAYTPTVMPAIWLDRLIGFQPLALPVYLSLWLYVSLLPAFFSVRAELYRYGLSMMLMCVAGLFIFYFWPTAAPAPDIDWSRYPDMDFLKNIDAAGNACPSLHVATAFFSAVWFQHLMRRFGVPAWILVINWIWCIAIVYSTVAVRQHVAVDAIAGLALGGVAAWLSLRYGGKTPLSLEVRRPGL